MIISVYAFEETLPSGFFYKVLAPNFSAILKPLFSAIEVPAIIPPIIKPPAKPSPKAFKELPIFDILKSHYKLLPHLFALSLHLFYLLLLYLSCPQVRLHHIEYKSQEMQFFDYLLTMLAMIIFESLFNDRFCFMKKL